MRRAKPRGRRARPSDPDSASLRRFGEAARLTYRKNTAGEVGMSGEEATVELIKHLRAALAITVRLGDKSAVYMVERALTACRRRWDTADATDVGQQPTAPARAK
jgi:hypothetical protein